MNYILNQDKIKELCQRAGLHSLGELCKKAKIHRNSITPYLKKEVSPFTQVVMELAKALNVEALDLITVDEDPIIIKAKNLIELAVKEEFLESAFALFIFGSRSRGSNQKFSDLDLGLTNGRGKLSFSRFTKIKSKIDDALDELPISINLVNLDLAPAEFLFEIEPDLKMFIGNTDTANFFLGYINGRKES